MQASPVRYTFTATDLPISRSAIEVMMNYEPDSTPEPFPQLIDEVLRDTFQLLDLKGGYIILPVQSFIPENRQLKVHDRIFNLQKVVYNQIKNASHVAVFQCTAGDAISLYSSEHMHSGELMKGYIADVIGSVAVEAAMDRIQEILENEMVPRGLHITNRYSPGYCDWNVSEQHILFSLFPENYYGIRLSDTSLMYPIKSVSGIIGIGPHVKKNDYTCKICDSKNCIYKGRRVAGI